MSEDTVNIEIDGRPLQARKGAMLIEVADENGIHIPRFCYHKKLSVAANCRMCLVEVEKVPKPVPACATPVNEGMVVRTRSAVALDAQKSVMEFLLINHPLDCPICDQGGECELQDVAMGYGGDVSRFQERKRVVPDKDIGPLIATDMTRCIHCTRCVRFGEEIAGMREMGATGRGEYVQIGTFIAKSVDSEMSGNIIDLCPVGALTSKPFRFGARAWEITQRAAIAPHDCIGSNISVHVHRGQVRRVVPRENEAVNETWLSDRDRFSYAGMYGEDRLTAPMIRHGEKWSETDWETALGVAVEGLKKVARDQGAEQLGALAAPGATVEEFYLLQKFVRGLGSSNIDHRVRQRDFSDQDHAPLYPWLGQSLADLDTLGAALVVGSNPRKDQPIVNHRLRKAALAGGRISFVNPLTCEPNYPVAAQLVAAPARMAANLAGVAKAALGKGKAPQGALGRLLKEAKAEATHKAIAQELRDAASATVLLGNLATAHPDFSTLRALAGFVAQQTGARLGYLSEGANAAGAWLAGALPHREAAGGKAVAEAGLDAYAMLEAPLPAYLLLGLEPELDFWDPALARSALAQAGLVVALTAFRSEALERHAHVMLPIAPFVETSGTFVNAEGLWQGFEGAHAPLGEARPAWKVLRVMANLSGVRGFDYASSQEVRDDLQTLTAGRQAQNQEAWGEPRPADAKAEGLTRIGSVPLYAGDALVRRSAPLQQTLDGREAAMLSINPAEAARLGLEEGGRAKVTQGSGDALMAVRVDAGIPDGCVLVPAGVPESALLGPCIGPVTVAKA